MKKLAVALALAALTLGPGFAADQKPATSTTSTTKTGKHHRRHHKKNHTTNSKQSSTQSPNK